MTRSLLAACALTLTAACQEPEAPQAAPIAAVDVEAVDFWDLHVGGSVTLPLSVFNDGDAALRIEGATISGPFEAELPDEVAPGGSADIELTFAPEEAGGAEGLLQIVTDDPDAPVIEVELVGYGLSPELDVGDTERDMGATETGCTSAMTIEIRNGGNSPMWIEAVDFSTSSVELTLEADALATLPWRLDPDSDPIHLELTYAPEDTAADSALLSVRSDDPNAPQADIRVQAEAFEVGETSTCGA